MPTSPNYTLTGTIVTPSATPDLGYALLELKNFTNSFPIISGTAAIAETAIKAICNGSGHFSILVFGNDQITPSSTYYTITLFSADGSVSFPQDYLLTGGGSNDLTTLTPITITPLAPPQIPIIANPTSNQAISGFAIDLATASTVNTSPATNDDSTKIATTHYVKSQVGGRAVDVNGSALSGTILNITDGPDIVPFDQGSGTLSFILGQALGVGVILKRFSLALNATILKNLKATPQIFVAHDPLVPERIFVPLAASLQFHHGTVAFTNTTTSDLRITFRSTDGAGGMTFDSNTILNQAGDTALMKMNLNSLITWDSSLLNNTNWSVTLANVGASEYATGDGHLTAFVWCLLVPSDY